MSEIEYRSPVAELIAPQAVTGASPPPDVGRTAPPIVGPVVTRNGGYAFDLWTRERGLRRGFCYRRVEDARYARRAEIRTQSKGVAAPVLACATVDQLALALGERENTPLDAGRMPYPPSPGGSPRANAVRDQ